MIQPAFSFGSAHEAGQMYVINVPPDSGGGPPPNVSEAGAGSRGPFRPAQVVQEYCVLAYIYRAMKAWLAKVNCPGSGA
ncbi:hypothetical protein PSCICM_16090 [Pseudomonas cichorii]|uniref:Uncharacterized protein n=1 Tax=Pseudomonas cichorii TaxID=36746 RepID=A0ABQ1DIN1_PSECI|nr:hypothetical protein PSCICM_16090 [Pseudomonas cichorii]GFM90869.1 hypothetical protein PSCICP_08410 [Pseudomonas cichorii]